MSEATDAVGRLIGEWQDARAALAVAERAEHPDIVDGYGRAWTWKPGRGDIYVHDGMAFPRTLVESNALGLPSQSVLDNPNYASLCAVCLDGRERNVPDCRPEWNCSHVMHQPAGEGFYVTVRHGSRSGALLSPYGTHDEALANVDRAREYAMEHCGPDAAFAGYGTAKVTAKPGRELRPGTFNDRIGLTAAD